MASPSQGGSGRHSPGEPDARGAPGFGTPRELGLDPWVEESRSPLRVDRAGRIYVVPPDGRVETVEGQPLLGEWLDLLGPFEVGANRGPDLRRPRVQLRIVPGKCSGEPHLAGSRITTLAVAALAERGYDLAAIARLYPTETPEALAEAIELEQQLAALSTAA